jgi:hypothetical protein
MMRQGIFIIAMSVGLSVVGAGAASAQVSSQGGAPTPGTGDSTRITSENREANATYNQRIGAADLKASKAEDRPKTHTAVKALPEDIKAGAVVRDIKGVQLGTIASVDANQAVLDTGQTKIGVPVVGFGKNDQGLLLNMTAEKFNQLVAQAHANTQAQAPKSN